MHIDVRDTTLLIDEQYLREPSTRRLAEVLETAAPYLRGVATSRFEGEPVAFVAQIGTEYFHFLTAPGLARLQALGYDLRQVMIEDMQVWVQDLIRIIKAFKLEVSVGHGLAGNVSGIHLIVTA